MFYNLRLESENYYYGILKETNCFNNETLKIAILVHMSKHVIKVNCPPLCLFNLRLIDNNVTVTTQYIYYIMETL